MSYILTSSGDRQATPAGAAIRYAALTDVGCRREHNEDSFLVDPGMSLFVVCDGMGGHAAGEVASAIAVRVVQEVVSTGLLRGEEGSERVPAGGSPRQILDLLDRAANTASRQIHLEASMDESKRGMGTTLVAMLVLGSQAYVVYVGDSRLYLLRDGVLQQVTEDHNVYNELLKRKKMTHEQLVKIAPKNAITRAVGVYEYCEPDTLVLDITAGDRFLLCTDGLSQYFEEDLAGLAGRLTDPEPSTAVRALIDAGNERGGSDNITTIVVTVGVPGSRDTERARRLQLKREMLSRMPLFRPLDDREILRVLQVTDVVRYADGEAAITEGEDGDELFIVLEGVVDVTRGEGKLTSLFPGQHFGEMALIRSQTRSATVRSRGVSELMVIRRSDFDEILKTEHQLGVKLLWQFLGVLADRLEATSRDLGAAQRCIEREAVEGIFYCDGSEDPSC